MSVKSGEGEQPNKGKAEAYICPLIAPSLLPASYGTRLWRQVVLRVDEIEAEMLLEWDEVTWHYYMTV
jgi:kinesin family protein 2/24